MGSKRRLAYMLLIPSMAVIRYAVTRETPQNNLLQEPLSRMNYRNSRRNLRRTDAFEVYLFLELQYLNETIADQLELYHNTSTAAARGLCQCIQEQTSGPIVSEAMIELKATAFVHRNENCTFLETLRVYDLEAESLFGPGYFALQLQVKHRLKILSNQSMPLDTVTAVISNSYAYTSGGRRLFITCLQQNDSFGSVISMDMTRELSLLEDTSTRVPSQTIVASTSSPTSSPTESPSNKITEASSTARPTFSPTLRPSLFPTGASTSQPTFLPTGAPTFVPSLHPTVIPSDLPSTLPTVMPSLKPSITYSEEPASKGTMSPSLIYWSSKPIGRPSPNRAPSDQPPFNTVEMEEQSRHMNDAAFDPVVIAAIAGGATTVVVTCIVVASMCSRRRKSIRTRRSQPKYALTTKDGQLSRDDPMDRIPGFVELDQRSLADTTLGEQTAGFGVEMTPAPKVLRRSDSFDDSSLYTTPCSVQRDEVLSYYQMHTGPSILASQITRPTGRDYSGNLLLPLSDSATTSSDGVSSYGPSASISSTYGSHIEIIGGGRSTHLQLSRPSVPIDLDTEEPYLHPSEVTSSFAQVRDHSLSHTIDETSASVDIDTWSCEFQDFDHGSDLQHAETRSHSASHSSRSTMKIKNLSTSRHRTDPPEQQRSQPLRNGSASASEPTGRINEVPNDQGTTTFDDVEGSLNYWSSWTSKIFQEGSSRHDGVGTTETAPKHQSPLSILLDSVTQAVTPVNTNRTIPIVTPEETTSDVDQPTETSLSREDESTLFGLQFKDEESGSSTSTVVSPSPWLLEKVEESLGPKSVTADMESLSGRSNLSRRSTSNRSKTGASMVSASSYLSYRSGVPHSDVAFAPRTLEYDLKQLEKQLAALDNDQGSISSTGVSSKTGTSITKNSISSRSRAAPKSVRRKKMVVVVPAGKLGVILANRHDGQGTIVSEIRESSPLYRMLTPGDKLVAVDDDDVQGMVVSQITSLMAARADRERRLTVITSVPQQYSKW